MKTIAQTLILLALSPAVVAAEQATTPTEAELPCKKRIIAVCSETEQGSPICEIIRSKRELTPAKFSDFLRHVGSLSDEQTREDLSCARLMGVQEFTDFPLSHEYHPSPNDDHIDLRVRYSDEYMDKFFSNIRELDNVGMSRYRPKWAGGRASFKGFISKVEFRDAGYLFYQAVIHVDILSVDSISMDIHGSSKEAVTGSSREWARITSESLKKAYQELMN